ncbi:hypothetical protein FRC12_007042 [Ceratobasidium sp. 428]|nr:hypothetical protein FRC12_007042 [Ceratobasidium sp. 428]
MLDNPDLPEEFAAQLEKMLDAGLKAEIEVVSATRASGPHALGGSRALDQYLHDKLAAVLGRVKEESQGIVKLESLSPYSTPGPASLGTSLKLEPQEFSPLGSQRSHSSLEHDEEGAPDVEYLDFDDDF